MRQDLLRASSGALGGDSAGGDLLAEAERLLDTGARPGPRATGRLAAELAEELVRASWRRGWQPTDLAAAARRQLPRPFVDVVGAVVGELTGRSPAARVDPRWRDQVAGCQPGGAVAARVRRFAEWAAEPAGLAAALAVIGLARSLPEVPSDLPLPGSATARPAGGGALDPRMLGRIRALLAKAESTTFPEEAEALSGKAQELMSRLSVDRLVVAAAASGGSGPAPVSLRRIWLDAPYLLAKAQLADSVARANRCRVVLDEALGFLTVLGNPADLATVEVLTTSLLVQANRAMLARGRQVGTGGRSRSRSFRQSFLVSYAVRIGERLARAAHGVVAAHPGRAELVPVLRLAEQRVADEVARVFPRLSSRGVRAGDWSGWTAGRAAADTARLGTSGELAG